MATTRSPGVTLALSHMTVPGAHAYRLDESGRVELERVVFSAVPE